MTHRNILKIVVEFDGSAHTHHVEEALSFTKKLLAEINKQSDPNTFAWKTHVFVYNEAPLKKVVKELEEVYKVHIGGIPQKEYYLTTTFDNTPIEDIIEIINQTLDTKLDITQ